jgi:predicted O-methyltransferase YrrM
MNIFKQTYYYLKYRIRANTLHGTHSPYVYQFLEQILYQNVSNESLNKIELRRADLLKDQRQIEITDLGAGSHQNNNRIKSIQGIAKSALKQARFAALYYRIIKSNNPEHIIELGTSLGITSSYMAMASTQKVYTLEGCPNTLSIAKETFEILQIKNVETILGNFDDTLPTLLAKLNQVDFIYFDGNHTKSATLHYFNLALSKANENSLFIFDDIYWSEEMIDAWKIIKADQRVSITIDLYFIGLVFFKKGQAKENFTILF